MKKPSTSMNDPRSAAQHILAERRAGRRFQPASDWYGPGFDLDTAYAVQGHYVALLQQDGPAAAVAGYKIGLTSPRMQAMCGVDQPIAGVVLAPGLQHSPGRVVAGDYIHLGIECEIAVRMAVDLAPGGPFPARASLDGLIDRVCAAIELVDDAAADYTRLDAASIAADNSWNAGLVLGSPADYDGRGLLGRRGVLSRDGAPLDEGMSDDVLGDPLSVVGWLAGHLHARGQTLRRGDWITTGSIVTTKFVKAGERYQFTIDGLQPVLLSVD